MARKSFIEEEYGLTGARMPFKDRIATKLQLEAWIDREAALAKWAKVLDDTVRTPRSNFFVLVIGDYGMGKTLSLLQVVEEAKRKGKLYPAYLNLLSEQRPRNPGLDLLHRILRAIDFEHLRVKPQDLDIVGQVLGDVGSALRKALFSPDDSERRLAAAFVKGEIRPTQSQLKTLEVIRKIDDVDVAKEYLIGLLCLLRASGFSSLVLAMDEFEYLFSLVPKPSQSVYLALLRGLFDLPVQIPETLQNSTANIAFFMGISEDGFRRLEELEKTEKATGGPIRPLMRRISDKIVLKPLSKGETQQLVERRLSLDRVKGKYTDEPLIPFTKKFVAYVYKLTGGKPSEILLRCDHVLDMGLEQRVARLTDEFARDVFEERGLSY